MSERKKYFLRKIPKVDEVLLSEEIKSLLSRYPRFLVVEAIQKIINSYRSFILSPETDQNLLKETNINLSAEAVEKNILSLFKPNLKRVINASGVILHTNLGRAPLSRDSLSHLIEVSSSYSNLEFDLERGVRGKRHEHLQPILTRLTGAESALIVNNNAAAVLLVLNTLAAGKEVVISRGELIEIGGSFRIPEVMRASGAKLVEVGTTNKTYLEDYCRAKNENTALLLKVHTSNYRIQGFTAEVSLAELVRYGKENELPVMYDIGSGCFLDLSLYSLQKEPTVKDAIDTGVDIVTFSGDKLLGGPQAGIIVGKKDYILKMEKNPLLRALRVDKLTLSALEATLIAYLDEKGIKDKLPVMKILTQPLDKIRRKAKRIHNFIKNELSSFLKSEVKKENSQVGGGALPLQELPTWVVALTPLTISLNQFEEKLRKSDPPIIGRISNGKIILDPRTIDDREINLLLNCLREIYYA